MKMKRCMRVIAAVGALVCGGAASAEPAPDPGAGAGACTPGWETGFTLPGIYGSVRAVVSWDDGTGPALFIGGTFESAGASLAKHIVKWTEARGYESLGDGIESALLGVNGQPFVQSVVVFDDGTGSALYVTGTFDRAGGLVVPGIARWTGKAWHTVDMTGWPTIRSVGLTLAGDVGSGDVLYMTAGVVDPIGGILPTVVRWNGVDPAEALGWPGTVRSMTLHDDGNGSALYVATTEYGNGNEPHQGRVHRWNGFNWESLPGVFEPYEIKSIESFDDGTGRALYVAGQFYWIDGVLVRGIARWRNGAWEDVSALAGVQPSSFPGRFFVWPDGASRSLLLSASPVLRWNGSAWISIGGPGGHVEGRLATLPIQGASALLDVRRTHNEPLALVRMWQDNVWNEVRSEPFTGMTDGPGSLLLFRGANQSEPILYGAGLRGPGTGWSAGLMHWNGVEWTGIPYSGGLVKGVSRSADLIRGGPDRLWVFGRFESFGGVPSNAVASFDGVGWASPGGGLTFASTYTSAVEARAAAVFDDGSGPALFVGGSFSESPGAHSNPRNYIAKWDGVAWTGVGRGMNGSVNALTVFDDGTGAKLLAGGVFTSAGGTPALKLAAWDGVAWQPVGGGVGGDVQTLECGPAGSAPALYVGGVFTNVGGLGFGGPVLARSIARWDGQSWSPLGAHPHVGVLGGGSTVRDIVIEPEPAAPLGYVVYIGGAFRAAGATPTAGLARWDGRAWRSVGGGLGDVTSSVTALEIGDDPEFPGTRRLYVGGWFTSVQGAPSTRFATYRLCSSYCPADTNGDLIVDMLDLVAVLSDFGQPSPPSASLVGDVNGDGVVDFLDLNIVLSAYGTAC